MGQLLALLFLALAAAIFLLQMMRLRQNGMAAASSFPAYLLLMIVGWAGTEILTDSAPASAGQIGKAGHLIVMGLFAFIITVHWRRARQP